MKVVMVNDCAFVGETLLKYLPSEIEKEHIKRSRGLWSKTFGLAYKILIAKGDVCHAHYLLQDCYVAARLGKRPLIGHAHGSDLRTSLQHPVWGRIVRHNLKRCDKVLVSTPDVLGQAKKFREEAEYLPNPVDTELFHFKPLVPHVGKKNVLIASDSNWVVKGTDVAIEALAKIKEDVQVSIIAHGVDLERTIDFAGSLGLRLNILPKVSHEKLKNYYWNADVVIDRFALGSLGMVSLEAIACGRPIITYVSSECHVHRDFPLKDINTVDRAVKALRGASQDLWKKEYDYLTKHHAPEKVAKKVMDVYQQLLAS